MAAHTVKSMEDQLDCEYFENVEFVSKVCEEYEKVLYIKN
jgi:hypothetical protein